MGTKVFLESVRGSVGRGSRAGTVSRWTRDVRRRRLFQVQSKGLRHVQRRVTCPGAVLSAGSRGGLRRAELAQGRWEEVSRVWRRHTHRGREGGPGEQGTVGL